MAAVTPGRRPPRPPQTFACGRRAARRRAIEARAIAEGRPALASVLAAVYARLGDQVWTVNELAGLELIDPSDTKATGFLLARHADQVVGGLRVCRLDRANDGRQWMLRSAAVTNRVDTALPRAADGVVIEARREDALPSKG